MKTRGLQDTNITCGKQAWLGGDAWEPRAFLPCPTLLQGGKSDRSFPTYQSENTPSAHEEGKGNFLL